MEKRKIESLRDLAIAHYPKAHAKRAQAIRHNGNRFADSGLQSAYFLGDDPEATAIEKQASELLQLTFMHPDALPLDPHTWDTVEDAETIAIKSHTLELAVENQPQIEAEMLNAARLLCELAGVALPPWVDAADAPAAMYAEAAPVVTAEADTSPSGDDIHGKMPRTGIGRLAIKAALQIEGKTGKPATANQVIAKLAEWIETEPILLEKIPHGIRWMTTNNTEANFNIEACGKALAKWNLTRP